MLRQIKSTYSVERRAHSQKLFAKRYPLNVELLLCLSSAILLIASFPNFNIWPFAWLGFVPLFFALQNKSKAKAFLISYLTGIIFWLGTIYWLIHVTLPGMIILVLYLALYFGIFGLIIKTYELRVMSYKLLFIPSLWVLLEYIRAHLFTGFPWELLGYSQYQNLPVIQIADITGAWGISFLIMMINAAIWQLILLVRGQKPVVRRNFFCLLSAACCLLFVIGYGIYKLSSIKYPASSIPIRISVIQGNIPQELKWDPGAKDFIIDTYRSLTRQAVKDKLDLIIWPEASLPVVLEEEPVFFERVKALTKEINIPLVLGAVTSRNGLYYNSALLVLADDQSTKYDKLHLVPFGEFIPLRKILKFLETIVPIGDFTAGKEYTIFKLPITDYRLPITFSVLICFEDIFPELAQRFVKKGARFLVNITNDAWFGKTSSPYQHFSASVFRAVENRVSLVRAANTGVSGFIAPSGEVIALVKDKSGRNIYIGGYATENIGSIKEKPTFYTRYGDIFIGICFLFVLYGIIRKNI